jgi:hypothetical protein
MNRNFSELKNYRILDPVPRTMTSKSLSATSYKPYKAATAYKNQEEIKTQSYKKTSNIDYLSLIAPKKDLSDLDCQQSKEEIIEIYKIKELLIAQEKHRKVIWK